MARLNWDRVRTENKIRKHGQERVEPPGSLGGGGAVSKGQVNKRKHGTRAKKRHRRHDNSAARKLNFLHQLIRAQLLGQAHPPLPPELKGQDIATWAQQQPQYQPILIKTRRRLEKQGQLPAIPPPPKLTGDLHEQYRSEIRDRYDAIRQAHEIIVKCQKRIVELQKLLSSSQSVTKM